MNNSIDLNKSFNKFKKQLFMNAHEARVLTALRKRPFEDLMKSVEVMAQSGNNFASFDPLTISEPEEIADKFRELGFIVTVSETNFKIEW